MALKLPPVWGDIPAEVVQQMLAVGRPREYKRGDSIFETGEPARSIYILQTGLVGLNVIGHSGKEHLLRFFRAGQAFGHRSLFVEESRRASAVALESTSLLEIAKPDLLDICEKWPRIYLSLIQSLSKELRRAEAQHILILENQMLARVAKTLVLLKDLHAEHNWTRQEIANFCASTTSTVIKTLAELERLGLIVQSGRSIEVLKRDELLALDGEI